MTKNRRLWKFIFIVLAGISVAAAQNSPHGSLAMECTACHVTTSWKEMKLPMDFNHSATSFPLTGAHATVACRQCHLTLRFAGAPTDCFTCHRDDFQRMRMPDHQRGQFSHDCTSCHSTVGWKPSTFDHRKTNFQLAGAHLAVDCMACHQNSKFAGTPGDCFSCHRSDFAAAQILDHQRSQFSHDCSSCHSMNGWKPSTFDHSRTNFSLQGAHITVDCSSCHKNSRFAGTPTECFSCHSADFAGAKAPDHGGAQFSHNCSTCHTAVTWRPSTFDHRKTDFQIVGAHLAVDCVSCHPGGRFSGTPTACFDCHRAEFNNALSHVASQFSHDCLTCHSMDSWSAVTFDHNKTTFPLRGAHQSLQCSTCHRKGQAQLLPTDCYSCHQKDYGGAATPNHQLNSFPHDCTGCHSENAWKPSTFNHSGTSFPLTGAHLTTDCLFCHKGGVFKNLTSTCFGCHQANFTNAANPNHIAGGFSQECAACHSTSSWRPALFDHNKTSFKLTGAHAQTQCSRCHVNNRFAGTPTDCYACHQPDYNAASNPNHVSARYPVTCAGCHSTVSWQPATFDHTPYFPINAGSKHSPGRWTFCSDCHVNQSNPSTFECINCHAHRKSSMDSEHREVRGYVYESAACYKCHPQGR